jgi:hypothetical protein
MGLVIRNPDVPESPPMSSAASSSGSISDDESVHIWSFEELNPYLRIHNQLNSVKEQLVDLQEEYRPTNRLMFASLDHGVLLRDAPENQAFLNHQGVLRELLNATLNLECPDPANTRNCKVCERRDELTGYINARLTLLDRNRKDQWKAEVQHRVNPWQSSRTSMRLPPPPARRPLPPLPFHRRN